MTGRQGTAWIVGAFAGLFAIVGGGVAVVLVLKPPASAPPKALEVGQCVRQSGKGDPAEGWVAAKCGTAAAQYTIVGIDPRGNRRSCHAIPGADRAVPGPGYTALCLMGKGTDPATSVNGAHEGDCVTLVAPDRAQLRACTDPGAQFRVVKRLENVPRDGAPCAAVVGATKAYPINWPAEGGAAEPGGGPPADDVVLCLAAPATAAPADTSPCRFFTDDELSKTLTAAAGRAYTTAGHAEDTLGCTYRLTGSKESIRIWWEPKGKFEPGSADQVFTLDGLRALYGPGEGNRYVDVEVEGGDLTIVVWLSNTGDAYSKNVGIALFRAARPRIRG